MLAIGKFALQLKSVRVEALDGDGRALGTASGFICREGGACFLYTCWHVVTGLDPFELQFRDPPNRRFIRIFLQGFEERGGGFSTVGGMQSHTLPLYDDAGIPLWFQNDAHVPNHDLNSIGLFVPFWQDAIKLALPGTIRISEPQMILEDEWHGKFPSIGDRVYVVGFPYGYSALGLGQPTPIVLTRFVAASMAHHNASMFLLDGGGAQGMSGGPVVVESDGKLELLGLYTGLIFPDHHRAPNDRERVTALGKGNAFFVGVGTGREFVRQPTIAAQRGR